MRAAVLWVTLSVLLAVGVIAPSARAVDNSDAVDLTSVRARIKNKDFNGALAELMPMLQSSQHADVYNLIGFSLRKIVDYTQAYTFYRKALELDPEHKGALEYLGELYVETGQLDKAREHVAILQRLCPNGCEELCRSRSGDRHGHDEGELRQIAVDFAVDSAALVSSLHLQDACNDDCRGHACVPGFRPSEKHKDVNPGGRNAQARLVEAGCRRVARRTVGDVFARPGCARGRSDKDRLRHGIDRRTGCQRKSRGDRIPDVG
jgi:hypothetical protein